MDESVSDLLGTRPSLYHLFCFIVAYIAGAGLAPLMAGDPNSGITMWAPSGVYMSALLLSRRAWWPWWILGALLAELSANLLFFGNPLPVAVGIHVGNACEALLGAVLIRAAVRNGPRLETLREVSIFIAFGAVLAPTTSALIGGATLSIAGIQSFRTAAPSFWIGDATGVLVFAPLILAMSDRTISNVFASRNRLLEGVLLILALAIIGALSMRGDMPFAYAVIPILIWTAVRFQVLGAAVMPVVLALTAVILGQTEQGASVEDLSRRHVILQSFIALAAVSALVVAALSRQHLRAVEDLRKVRDELEDRVAERTATIVAAQRRTAAMLEALPLGVALIDPNGDAELSNSTYDRYVPGRPPSMDEKVRQLWRPSDDPRVRVLPDDMPARRALRGEIVWPGQEFRFLGDASRGPFWARVSAVPFKEANGIITGAILIVEDVDRERQAADVIRLSEERLRIAQDAAELGNWEMDNQTGIPILSERARAMIGLPPDEPATADALFRHVHPDDLPILKSAIAAAEAPFGPNVFRADYRILAADGSVRWLEDRGKVDRDADGRAVRTIGMVRDITERKLAEQHAELLMREVNHRSKNMLGLVQVIARQTVAGDPLSFVERFEQRIRALASSQDLLVQGGWRGARVGDLVTSQLAHLADLLGTRIRLDGPPVTVNAEAAQTLGIALHELATNAAKYGALSNETGRILITWRLAADVARFSIRWTESDGPAVLPPTRRGFGSAVLERMSRLSLDADAELGFDPAGVSWTLTCDARRAGAFLDPA